MRGARYDFNEGVSNRHGRPHAILITDTIDSVVEGLNFIKSQMSVSLLRHSTSYIRKGFGRAAVELRPFLSGR